MLNESLKPVLGEELFSQVAEKLSAHPEIELANVAEGYVTQADFDTAKNEAEAAAATATAQIAELTAQFDTGKQSWADEKSALSKDFAIEKALLGSKAKSVDDFAKRLDREKISLEDGKLVGFDEQITSIRAAAPYLFEDLGATAPPLNPAAQTAPPSTVTGRIDAAVETLVKPENK